MLTLVQSVRKRGFLGFEGGVGAKSSELFSHKADAADSKLVEVPSTSLLSVSTDDEFSPGSQSRITSKLLILTVQSSLKKPDAASCCISTTPSSRLIHFKIVATHIELVAC